ncbi:hypothetical protein COOONC_24305 [Cooperia oncophora]
MITRLLTVHFQGYCIAQLLIRRRPKSSEALRLWFIETQAPEVLRTGIYTTKCDIYSYGILIWEIFHNA